MKIRNGFVSNSSSSSFILSKNNYETSIELAKEMLKIRKLEWEGWGTKELDALKHPRVIQKILVFQLVITILTYLTLLRNYMCLLIIIQIGLTLN